MCAWTLAATPQGRWHSEFTSATREALVARRLLYDALGAADVSQSVADTPSMLGMIVFQSWHFVHDRASHSHTWAMMQACQAAHRRRSGMKFLEHIALATYSFSEHERAMNLPEHGSTMLSRAIGRIWLEKRGPQHRCCVQADVVGV